MKIIKLINNIFNNKIQKLKIILINNKEIKY